MVQTILVLGGSYAGLQIAHRLLKHTLPAKEIKVVLVSKNSHLYWNLASVRAIIPGIMKEEEYMAPIAKVFANYPATAFEFIVGAAESVDFDTKSVRISVDGSSRNINYDHLVLATGSRTASAGVPWKANGTHEEIVSLLHRTADGVKAAKHILVAGGGPTGVETSGELAYEFKDKQVVLVNAGPKLLNGDVLADSAEKELTKLGVKVRNNKKVASSKTLPNGQTEVTLEGGETITTDLYLPTLGVLPNSEYLPSGVLNAKGFVQIDDYFRVINAKHVWAAGDIVWKPRGGLMITDKQAAGVAKNIDLVLKAQAPVVVKLLPVDALICATGRNRGVIRVNNYKLFSFMAYYGKVKTLGTQMMPGILTGTAF